MSTLITETPKGNADVIVSMTNDPLAEPPGAPNVTFSSSKPTMSALAAVDPTNTAYAAMMENAASAALIGQPCEPSLERSRPFDGRHLSLIGDNRAGFNGG